MKMKMKKIQRFTFQSSCVTNCGDIFYFHWDKNKLIQNRKKKIIKMVTHFLTFGFRQHSGRENQRCASFCLLFVLIQLFFFLYNTVFILSGESFSCFVLPFFLLKALTIHKFLSRIIAISFRSFIFVSLSLGVLLSLVKKIYNLLSKFQYFSSFFILLFAYTSLKTTTYLLHSPMFFPCSVIYQRSTFFWNFCLFT